MPNFHQDVLDEGFRHLDVTATHSVHGGLIEGVHKDPFDRLIAAQALMEGMTLITCDREIAALGCRTLW